MRARIPANKLLSGNQKKAVVELATKEAERQIQAATTRAQYLWMAAMLNAGYKIKSVENVSVYLDKACKKYAAYKEDGCGDAALVRDLKAAGLDLPPIPGDVEL